jgi:hypothetical protein
VKTWIQKRSVRNLAALLVIGFGVWTIAWVVSHKIHKGHDTDSQNDTKANMTISLLVLSHDRSAAKLQPVHLA